jgi:hypothetical protein
MQGLRELYKADKTAQALFDTLAKRVNNSREQKVDQLERSLANDGVEASRRDITRVLKALEHAGCGEYIVGRKGHPSRFRWDVEMVAVGRYAAGISTDIGQVDPSLPSEDEDISAEVGPDGRSAASPREFTHGFQLRPQLPVSFRLPADLTTAEAARLADFIKTLPFDLDGR